MPRSSNVKGLRPLQTDIEGHLTLMKWFLERRLERCELTGETERVMQI